MSEIRMRDEGERTNDLITSRHPFPTKTMEDKTPGIETTEVPSGTDDVQAVGAKHNMRLMGASVRENAATAAVATVILRHGKSANDPALAIYELDANQSARDWFGPHGLVCPGGIFVDRVAGTTHLVIYWKAVS